MRVKNPAALRRRRLNKKYTQRELGFLVKRTHATIGALETGKMKTCTEDLALLICARLDVDWEDYFDLEEHEVMPNMASGVDSPHQPEAPTDAEHQRSRAGRRGAAA